MYTTLRTIRPCASMHMCALFGAHAGMYICPSTSVSETTLPSPSLLNRGSASQRILPPPRQYDQSILLMSSSVCVCVCVCVLHIFVCFYAHICMCLSCLRPCMCLCVYIMCVCACVYVCVCVCVCV